METSVLFPIFPEVKVVVVTLGAEDDAPRMISNPIKVQMTLPSLKVPERGQFKLEVLVAEVVPA